MGRLADDIQEGLEFDQQLESRIKAELVNLDFPVLEVAALRSAAGQFEIRVKLPACDGHRDCPEMIVSLVSGLIGQPMLTSKHNCRTGEICELVMEQAWPYMLDLGVATKARRVVSGDTHTAIVLKGGKHMLVLSDGMGFGPRAAKESKATVDLLEKLLASGFDKDLAIRTVNHFLSLRSVEETFSTLDLALVDLNNGMTDLVKIGSAPSFIRRHNQVEIVRSVSLPLGVLDSLEVECEQRMLSPGDILIMVTDGILDGGDGADREAWLIHELEISVCDDAQLMAETLLEAALEKTPLERRDDMTVLVARFDFRHKPAQPASVPDLQFRALRSSAPVSEGV
jgi:stage II sporulation protein E